jgi:hypothetical protein
VDAYSVGRLQNAIGCDPRVGHLDHTLPRDGYQCIEPASNSELERTEWRPRQPGQTISADTWHLSQNWLSQEFRDNRRQQTEPAELVKMHNVIGWTTTHHQNG